MKFEEAKEFLKEGMKIKIVNFGFSSPWKNNRERYLGKSFKFDGGFYSGDDPGIAFNIIIGPVVFKDDELEILTEEDGVTPWKDPRVKEQREFKVGDRVKVKRNCSGCESGGIYTLHYGDREERCVDIVFAWSEKVTEFGCSCEDNWELLSEGLEEAKDEDHEEMIFNLYSWYLKNQEFKFNMGMDFGYEEQPKKKGFMNNIAQKIKDLALSKTDKILRKHGLEDSEGKRTSEADDIMDEEILAERWKARREEIATDLAKIDAEEKK